MTRKSYKALYLHQLQAAGENEDRAKRAEARLKRINKALAPLGQKVLHAQSEPTPENIDIAIGLEPYEYVAVEAFFESNQRVATGDVSSYGTYWSNLTWRGRRVMQL